jgi:hypothetical protein
VVGIVTVVSSLAHVVPAPTVMVTVGETDGPDGTTTVLNVFPEGCGGWEPLQVPYSL